MKRKTVFVTGNRESTKERKVIRSNRDNERWQPEFAESLFEEKNISFNKVKYSRSTPYKHGVIEGLVNDSLLRRVRDEVLSEICYTQKETDIYKIHQSGDLANLDGLDETSLSKLPNLLKLRDALYSPVFREYLENVTECGKLSGTRTDMAINIYSPGSHLLCHDDVIGTRRISYILYLTDPDDPWQDEWGGALRLFPTVEYSTSKGVRTHVPLPDPSLSILPRWNQLSFFAVQPGLSFHDVGEVFENFKKPSHLQPMRVAISGWYHIPQLGEDGYIRGEAETLQKESSLTTLRSGSEELDYPRSNIQPYIEYRLEAQKNSPRTQKHGKSKAKLENDLGVAIVEQFGIGQEDPDFDVLTEAEAEFLCQYINPQFLTPDQAEEMSTSFSENGQIIIDGFLHPKFAKTIEHYISNHFPQLMPHNSETIERDGIWTVARPPHKHKYLVLNEQIDPSQPANEMRRMVDIVFRSLPFRKWLQIITGLIFKSQSIRVRRFRRGQDYQLAKLYEGENGRVEITLGLTPHGKWEAPIEEDSKPEDEMANTYANLSVLHQNLKRAPVITFEPMSTDHPSHETNNGGYEMFIRGDDDNDGMLKDDNKQPQVGSHSHLDVTGKQDKTRSDPAIYKAADDDDDGILLNMAAGFNRISIVLRDSGSMRFVKYVSRRAGYDRWDLTGEFEVDWKRSADAHGWEEDEEASV